MFLAGKGVTNAANSRIHRKGIAALNETILLLERELEEIYLGRG
jgi:hypothetical protein